MAEPLDEIAERLGVPMSDDDVEHVAREIYGITLAGVVQSYDEAPEHVTDHAMMLAMVALKAAHECGWASATGLANRDARSVGGKHKSASRRGWPMAAYSHRAARRRAGASVLPRRG
jgi:lactate dehydrogenase-like 2-hydroxyacid dehydrogenase